MLKTFPFFRQWNQMDNKPICLQMVTRSYRRNHNLPLLREISHISKEKRFFKGFMEAVDCIGFRIKLIKVFCEKTPQQVPPFFKSTTFWNRNRNKRIAVLLFH